MAIDYGTRRMGIAVTDPLQIIATPLTTIHPKDAIKFFKEYFLAEEVSLVVFGDPKQNDNSPSESKPALQAFMNLFKKQFPEMPLELIDERYTSKMAMRTMIDAGVKKKDRRDKSLIDRTAAVIILQSYMQYKNG